MCFVAAICKVQVRACCRGRAEVCCYEEAGEMELVAQLFGGTELDVEVCTFGVVVGIAQYAFAPYDRGTSTVCPANP
jgi:hypothetical protein